MDVTHLTYARVAEGLTPQRPSLQPSDVGVDAFLRDHVRALLQLAERNDASPPGRFTDNAAAMLFRSLHTGTDEEFVAAAYELTSRLIGRMNGRTADGLLVCLRTAPEARGSIAGALKLQVDAPNAAILQKLESGDVVLAAVKDMLEKPGDLQKGALVTSWLADGQVICGDKLIQAARYFPEAFDIRLYSRPSASTRAFFDAVESHAGHLTAQVAEAWPTLQSGSPRRVVAELGSKVPEFTTSLQTTVAEALESATRPIATLDTQRDVTETYKAGDIRVSGPITAMRQNVHIQELRDRKMWQIVVDSTEKPVPQHR